MISTTLPLLPAILVSLVTLFGCCEYIFANPMINRPIVLAPLVGLALGDLHTGIIMGASLELVFMGVVTIGSTTPPDTVSGSVMGTALAMMTHQGVEIALALALPISMLAQSMKIAINTLIATQIPRALRLAEQGKIGALGRLHWWLFSWTAIPMTLITFFAVLLGADAVKIVVDAIPPVVIQGMDIASKILPAVGFALLLKLLWRRELAVYFYLGFLLATLLKLSILGISLLGVILAIIVTRNMLTTSAPENATANDADEVIIHE